MHALVRKMAEGQEECQRLLKRVKFAPRLETIHLVERWQDSPNHHRKGSQDELNVSAMGSSVDNSSCLTEEILVLSTAHGRSRRYLREITKGDLRTAVKYGTKTQSFPDRRTGLPRLKYTYNDIVYITDHTSTVEITSYKKAVSISPAPISEAMLERHYEVEEILHDNPLLCTSHTFVILDQSGSMRNSDVNGFRNRSQAAYGCLALDYVSRQLQQAGSQGTVDAFTLIEMRDQASVFCSRAPLDWILFNELLDRQKEARPRFHGNYVNAIRLVFQLIASELTHLKNAGCDDLPVFSLVFLSDGKPSDNEPEARETQVAYIEQLARGLRSKLTVLCMGLGASGSDFVALQDIAAAATENGANGSFNHAGLSAANLGKGFSSLSSTMTSLRTESLKVVQEQVEDPRTIVKLKHRDSMKNSTGQCQKFLSGVVRYKFNLASWLKYKDHWDELSLRHKDAAGFLLDEIPFGKGAERLAFRFQEIDKSGGLVDKMLVAKESRHLISQEDRKTGFHMHFCRTQTTALELANKFNEIVAKEVIPTHGDDRVPVVRFVNCHVYVYVNREGNEAGLLVEKYLEGKFRKYNGNNGFVNTSFEGDRKIEIPGGECRLTDFLHAFSHWTHHQSSGRLLVCDSQGVLDEEGRVPIFELTDPAICSINRRPFRFGKTDLGEKGFKLFCRHHRCNLVCKALGLPAFGTRAQPIQ